MSEPTVFFALNVFDEVGGASRLLVEIATALARRGRRVAVYAAYPSAPANAYVERLRREGVEVHEAVTDLRVGPSLRRTMKPLFEGGWIWRTLERRGLFQFVVAGQPPRIFYRHLRNRRLRGERVVVHIQRGPEALRWVRRCGAPALYVENSTPDRERWIDSWWAPVLQHLAAARVVVAGSERAARGVREALGWTGSVAVLPWIVGKPNNVGEPDEVGTRRLRGSGAPFVLGAAGRLSPEKGFDLLLRALAALDRGESVRLRVAGDGDERGRLEEFARVLGIADHVEFLGDLREGEMEGFWSSIDALVVPSRLEGTPMVALDAMVRGIAVVATAVGGVPELLEGGACGVLVAEPEPDLLAAGIARCIDDRSGTEQRAGAARERVLRVHGEAGLDQWIALYDSLAEAG